jgi:hypothetical protein
VLTEGDTAILRLSTIASNTTLKRLDNTSEMGTQLALEGHLREVSYDVPHLDDSGT